MAFLIAFAMMVLFWAGAIGAFVALDAWSTDNFDALLWGGAAAIVSGILFFWLGEKLREVIR